MSILIKGMEMPTDCITCSFCDYEQGLCLAANDMDTAPRTIGKRHDNCPLVPIPPHGEWYGEADGYADGELVYDTWSCGYCGKHFPEWDEKPDWNYCPNCGADMREES